MKKMIIGLIALVSITSTSFASLLEVSATNDDIRDAIIASLERSNLKCIAEARGQTAETTIDYAGLRSFFVDNYELTTSSELPEPMVELVRTDQDDKQISRLILTATLSPDQKRVVKLSVSFYDNVQRSRINVGTILNPIFQEGLDNGAPYIQYVCK